MKKLTKISISIIFIFLIGVFYLSLSKSSHYDTKNIIGKKISKIELTSFTGNKVYNNEILKKNKFTLINFWASWCSPCRNEHPYLMALSKNKNLNILGINFKDKDKTASIFLEELGNPYDFLVKDASGKQSVTFGIYGIPESILINKETFIIKKFVGPLNDNNFKEIEKILKEQ
tara:strand:- start:6843 stop:7364 length:522 start_codon:yes stop_codon:yes gene_type:complete